MPVGGVEFFGEFETEHLLSQELYKDEELRRALEDAGYTRDMAGNRRSLFTSTEITEKLAGLSTDDPYRVALRESGWGSVAHRGGDTEVGGYQQGKNDLVRVARRLGLIGKTRRVRRAELVQLSAPLLIALADGSTAIMLQAEEDVDGSRYLIQRADAQRPEIWQQDVMDECFAAEVLLVTSRERVAREKRRFDVSWFVPALVKYRRPLRDVLVGSFFLQLTGLVSPVFFQLVIDIARPLNCSRRGSPA